MTGAETLRDYAKQYAAAIVLVACAVGVALAMRPLFNGRVPQTIFTIAVFGAAAYGGLGPGLIATGLSAALTGWLFRDEVFSIVPMKPTLLTFCVLGVVISLIMEQFRSSRSALQRSKERLEQANAELSRRSEALALSNEELRRFAYALSHDLQNPLRTVSVFAERLALQNKESLDEASTQSLRFVMEGVERMQEMIRGLLDYSTVVHDHTAGEQAVDCGALIRTVLEDLRGVIEESGAKVTFDPLPVIVAGLGPLRQLFLNVISNALKYHDQRAPEVHVSAKRNGSEWIFSVRDNGIGIDMQYAEKIFGVFERLHGSSQYGGSGIGLAICRAIVQRYGGRIWLESELGRGSTFFFTMPGEKPEGKKIAQSA